MDERGIEMAEKRFLSWLGFNTEAVTESVTADSTSASGKNSAQAQPVNTVARIRELEAQLADLRSRRDLTSLTKEEFEILATETAMTLVRTAQTRESRSITAAQKLAQESARSAQIAIAEAQSVAKQLLTAADGRGKRVLQNAEESARQIAREAEASANQTLVAATREIESLVSAKKKEASNILSAARRNADGLVSDAIADVNQYKSGLSHTMSETERVYKWQMTSLAGAADAIEEAKSKFTSAYATLKEMHSTILANVTDGKTPPPEDLVEVSPRRIPAPAKRRSAPRTPATKSVAKKSVAKSAKPSSSGKPVTSKKSAPSKASTRGSARRKKK